jgi:anti-sigma factor RsiW
MMQALDGELMSEELAEMEKHVLHCPGCREEWAQLQTLDHLLRQAPTSAPPAGFTGRVMARIDRRRRTRHTVIGALALTLGTLASLGLLLSPALAFLSSFTNVVEAGLLLLLRLSGGLVALVESLLLTADALFAPIAFLAACGLSMALFANLTWLALVRRLHYGPAMPSNL